MKSLGEALIDHLEVFGVEVIFGIPGVHTIELYRGIANSNIRHVTPRHEQGAGFMADGYARVTGKPGVALVITGPGVTNTITPMAQARADSVPILVISSVNALPHLGKGLGHLHELPDQQALIANVACQSIRIENKESLPLAMTTLFEGFKCLRPGPMHIEIPLDVAKLETESPDIGNLPTPMQQLSEEVLDEVVATLSSAKRPVILAGGGMRFHDELITELACQLDAPVILTANARGLMHEHELLVPASPSLEAVRELINQSDAVLALGTELGQTDYDVYATGTMPDLQCMIRVDICKDQLARHDVATAICADAGAFSQALLNRLANNERHNLHGGERAIRTRNAAYKEIGEEMRAISALLDVLRDAAPNSIMVGDSTQPVYAGNLYYDHDRAGGWFNAATGYGALGYGIPAAIGAAIGSPGSQVICLCGDGGAQFSLSEMMVAADEKLPIIFVIWNNRGYQEIETSMKSAGVSVVGCDPTPPDFRAVAASCGILYYECDTDPQNIKTTFKTAHENKAPTLIEFKAY